MDQTSVQQIVAMEETLRLAMLNSDLPALDSLLSEKLMFTNHLGHVINKQQDLSAHREGIYRIRSIDLSDCHIQLIGDIAMVSVLTKICAGEANQHSEGEQTETTLEPNQITLRFTRVWHWACVNSTSNPDDYDPVLRWQVLAGHSSALIPA